MNVPLDPDGRLRLTVVSPFGELGGGEIWLLRLLDATTSLDVSVILLRDGPLAAACTERGIPVAVLQVGARPQDLARSWLPLRRRLREQRPDVILANGIKAEAAVGPVARSLRIPHVWVKHDHSFDRRLTPILARVACSVIITAEELAPATRRSDVITIHPPMPPYAPYAAADARARIDALAGASSLSTLAMLTRLTPYKGVDAAIQALAGAPGWRLVVFGGDDPVEPGETLRLHQLAEALGVADRVALAGFVPDAAQLLSGVDALAVLTRPAGPRTPCREGFGMTAMEAMIAGVPVIAPDDGGPVGQRIADGAGVLVDATSSESIAQALLGLTPDVRQAFGTEARRRASSMFSTPEVAAARFVDTLRAVSRPPGPAGSGTDDAVRMAPAVARGRSGHVGRLSADSFPEVRGRSCARGGGSGQYPGAGSPW